MSDFSDAMTAALSQEAGDTSTDTSPETQAAVEPSGSPETQQSSADTPTSTGSDTDLRSYLDAKKAARPELAEEIDAIHREFQRGLTPKLQEAAELRKQFEGIDPSDVQFLRQVQELAAISPEAAATLWDQARQSLLAPYQPAEPQFQPQPQGELEYATDTERVLHQQLQEVNAWRSQQILAQTKADMDRQFAEIGKEVGSDVPFEERQAAANYCLRQNIQPTQIGLVWKGLYGMQSARRAGRDEAASVVTQKAAMTPGPSSITPPASSPPREPKSQREALEMAFGVIR